MNEGAGVHQKKGSAARQWSIPTRLTLSVLPVAVVSLLTGLVLVWTLISSDTTGDLSAVDIWAVIVALVVGIVTVGSFLAVYLNARSMSRDIKSVSSATQTVAKRDLAELLDALRAPDADLSHIRPPLLDVDRQDEVGDLVRSFGELHSSLKEVAARQIEALRNGVSSIFVTLARRNSSLVDRQLALLDKLESREEDAETLGGYYQLDHLATRMRRNAESLLVLAGSESPRMWSKATDMTDVVRAAIGEVDEYQRIEVVALEPAKLSGGAVSDVAHLFAELLENAIQFSPPSEAVRVTGLFDASGYQLTVSDRGVGVTDARIAELNRILTKPPALGLSVEPTMGMYVVAKLAHRHGVVVELIRGAPGLSAKVTIPRDHLETVKKAEPRYWEERSGRPYTARTASHPSAGDYPDTATREYILRQTAGSSTSEDDGPDRVIDLTGAVGETDDPTGTLPVRAAGAFGDKVTSFPSSEPGDAEIKSALTAYERGRRAAAAAGGDEPDDEEDPT
jgi:signal transduction histidine kinase